MIIDAGATWREAVLSHPNAISDEGLIDTAATARLFRKAQVDEMIKKAALERRLQTPVEELGPAEKGEVGGGGGGRRGGAIVDAAEGADGNFGEFGDDVVLRALAAGLVGNYQNVVAKLVDASATASRIRHTFSKVLSTGMLHGKRARALTFENLWAATASRIRALGDFAQITGQGGRRQGSMSMNPQGSVADPPPPPPPLIAKNQSEPFGRGRVGTMGTREGRVGGGLGGGFGHAAAGGGGGDAMKVGMCY